MKTKLLGLALAAGVAMSMTACAIDNSTPERVAVVKEMVDFQKKCKANPQDAECVKFSEMYQGGN